MRYVNQRPENLVKALNGPLQINGLSKKVASRGFELLLGLIVCLIGMADAHAYIDPGSSLLVLQGVLAAVGGILIFIRHPVKAIRNIFSKLKKNKISNSTDKKDA